MFCMGVYQGLQEGSIHLSEQTGMPPLEKLQLSSDLLLCSHKHPPTHPHPVQPFWIPLPVSPKREMDNSTSGKL